MLWHWLQHSLCLAAVVAEKVATTRGQHAARTTSTSCGAVNKLPSDSFIMTAVDGDTFTLVIDRNTRKAQITPLNTMYGVEAAPSCADL